MDQNSEFGFSEFLIEEREQARMENTSGFPEVLVYDPSVCFEGFVQFDEPYSTTCREKVSVVKTKGLKVRFIDGLPVINCTLSAEKYLLVYHVGRDSRTWAGRIPDFDIYGAVLITSKVVKTTSYPEEQFTEKFGYTALFRIIEEAWSVEWAVECPYTGEFSYHKVSSAGAEVVVDTEMHRDAF
jgi:hypothetical protein